MPNETAVTASPFARDMLALTKPRITLMTIIVALGSMCLAPSAISFAQALCALVGIALLVSGSSAFNMYIERHLDGLMTRTKNRPLPSGRMKPFWALFAGWTLSLLAIPALWLGTNPLTVMLGVFSLAAYVLVYTPMKQMSCFALVVGAVPGAMPALMGYTAAYGKIDKVALALFGVAFLWQLPHFIAISMFRCDEYTRAGYPVVPKVVGNTWSIWLILASSLALVATSFLLWWFEVGHWPYALCAAALGAWFIYESLRGFFVSDLILFSKRVFFASLVYQMLLFLFLAADVIAFKYIQ
jgi:protoheme IX farnesyltransferase